MRWDGGLRERGLDDYVIFFHELREVFYLKQDFFFCFFFFFAFEGDIISGISCERMQIDFQGVLDINRRDEGEGRKSFDIINEQIFNNLEKEEKGWN